MPVVVQKYRQLKVRGANDDRLPFRIMRVIENIISNGIDKAAMPCVKWYLCTNDARSLNLLLFPYIRGLHASRHLLSLADRYCFITATRPSSKLSSSNSSIQHARKCVCILSFCLHVRCNKSCC